MIDHTHDSLATSWVASANGHRDFPLQNLPLGIFAPEGADFRPGVAIGDMVLDLRALALSGMLDAAWTSALGEPDLKAFLALGAPARVGLRHRIFALLESHSPHRALIEPSLRRIVDCALALPARPNGYTDFFAGIVHATNAGRIFRPDNPLLPNYKHVPIGYHGRTSSIRPSGTPVRRPLGQVRVDGKDDPVVAPSRRLDYELELGLWLGKGNQQGEVIGIRNALEHLAGVTLLNDWSARDVQSWEYQPLGPFLAKNFATTVSPWLVTIEALAPFRAPQQPRPDGDPAPLPYLWDEADQDTGALAIDMEVAIRSARMRSADENPVTVGRTSSTHLYWTPAQLITHHAMNGCPLEPGDLLGTGTISAPDKNGFGSLLEITAGGRETFLLGGVERKFIEDGDEVVMSGRCTRDGFATIGFGECRAVIEPAREPTS